MSASRGQKRTRLKSSRSELSGATASIPSPPVKRTKNIPENQLKLERVLKATIKDSTIIQHCKAPRETRATNKKLPPKGSGSKPEIKQPKAQSEKATRIKNTNNGSSNPQTAKSTPTKLDPPSVQKTPNDSQDDRSKYFAHERNQEKTTAKIKGRLKNNAKSKQPNSEASSQKDLSKTTPTKENLTKSTSSGKGVNKAIGKSERPKTTKAKTRKTIDEKKESSGKPKTKKRPTAREIAKGPDGTPKKLMKLENIPSPSQALVKMDVKQESDTDESDWEEVEDIGGNAESPEKSQLPTEPVTITLQGPDLMKKKKKGAFDMEAYIRRQINRAEREIQLEMHKVHLLCLLSHGFHRNRLCKDQELLALGLSVYPFSLINRDVSFWDTTIMTKLVKWFASTFVIGSDVREEFKNMKRTIIKRFASRTVASEVELIFLFLIILRSVGVPARLVYSLQPVSHKCSTLLKARKKKGDSEENTSNLPNETEGNLSSQSKPTSGESKEKGSKTQKDTKKKESASSVRAKAKNRNPRSKASKVYSVENSDDEASMKKATRKAQGKRNSTELIEVSSDSDFEVEEIKFRKSPSVSKRKSEKTKIVSSDSDDLEVTKIITKEIGSDMWVEIYMERNEGWIPVDPIRARVNHPSELESRATQPVYYVLAYDNENCIKDVTSRYSSSWMSTTRKLRVVNSWWDEVLHPYRPRNTAREQAENARLQTQQLKKPLPTSVTEYKNHPLYALKRHFLKFEGLYPADAVPVGFVKGEPVYARENVHTLHTRETWLKEGRAVRVKEQPYKLVKARKKKSRKAFEYQGSAEVEMAQCFGMWQTEKYMPAPVFNGKIPRNEYGNLELFKPWMLPPGGVHLRLPGLNRIAKKMNMDCVPAMVGWDQHSGFSHPLLDGFIVCEEHKDILIAAWDEQQEIEKEKEREKREKRVLLNWKTLTRGLVIKERMKVKFGLEDAKKPAKTASKGKSGGEVEDPGKKATDMVHAWPMNRFDDKNQLSTSNSLFPTEEL